MNERKEGDMELPERLLPESLDELGVEEVLAAAKATARLVDRSHHDLPVDGEARFASQCAH